jgi:hypothetical protein
VFSDLLHDRAKERLACPARQYDLSIPQFVHGVDGHAPRFSRSCYARVLCNLTARSKPPIPIIGDEHGES